MGVMMVIECLQQLGPEKCRQKRAGSALLGSTKTKMHLGLWGFLSLDRLD